MSGENEALPLPTRITHLRRAMHRGEPLLADKRTLKAIGLIPEPSGGLTIARVTIDGQVHVGTAKCRADEPFNRKIGRSIAVSRAMKR